MRRDSNRAVATDRDGHELRINDNMKESEGEVSPLFDLISLHELNTFVLRAEKDVSCISTNRFSPSFTIVILPRMEVSSSHGPVLSFP